MFSLCLQPRTRQGGGGGASLRNFVRGPTASSLALPQTCRAPLSQSLPLSEPQSKPSRGRTSLGLPPLSLCLLWVFDAFHFRLGFSEGMTCMCPSPRCPWSGMGVDRWMNRQRDKLEWQLRLRPWPQVSTCPGPVQPDRWADRWQGLRAPRMPDAVAILLAAAPSGPWGIIGAMCS